MSEGYDSFLDELDKELDENNQKVKVQLARRVYRQECEKRKKSLTTGIVLMVVFELLVLACVGYFAYINNFHLRTLYEYENILFGRIIRESGTYVGATDFGYFEGTGTFNFTSGTVYKGEWDNNAMSGIGTLTVPDLGEYTGDFSDSQKNGFGTFTWSDGTIYKGFWLKDALDGDGEYRTDDGTICKGTFKDNKLYTGTCQFRNQTGSYKLEYSEGEVQKAQIAFKDGSYYVGESDGMSISGKGKIAFANGDSYEGGFVRGQRSGNGKYTWSSGEVYDGEWMEDHAYGEGTYSVGEEIFISGIFKMNRLENGTSVFINEYGEYNTTVVDGKIKKASITLTDGTTIEGEGDENGSLCSAVITYPNGDVYNGEIKDGMKNGKGNYKWKKGASYSGSWKNDVMSGTGTYYYSSESNPKLTVNFKDGKPSGEGNYTTKNGKTYQTTWKDGKCVKVTE